MSNFRNGIFISLVSIQLLFIAWYGHNTYQKIQRNKTVLGATSVSPIKKEDLVFSSEGDLMYFYEDKPNTVMENDPNWLGYKASNTINSDSLNERFDYSVNKPSATFRIITLGDSFTFGHYVNTADNWPEQLEDILNTEMKCSNGIDKFEVINLGEHGYDIEYIVHRYQIRGVKYNPDLILWFESGTGFTRFLEKMTPFINKYKQQLTDEERESYIKSGTFYPEWTLAQEEVLKKYSREMLMNELRSHIETFLSYTQNKKVVFGSFANLAQENKETLLNWTRGHTNASVTFSIPDIYSMNGFLADWHPNSYGHKLIAQAFLEYLLISQVIPCEFSQSGSLQ